MRILGCAFAVLALSVGCGVAQAEGIGWQEAVARLAHERTRAESCVRLLRTYGDEIALIQGDRIYTKAKAEIDAVISGLIVALAQDDERATLPDLETRLRHGINGRETLCEQVTPLVPDATGEKDIIVDMMAGALGPTVEAVAELYLDAEEADRLTRATILTQLEATKWPAFTEISSAKAGPAGLYDRPTLVLDPAAHTGPIRGADVDAAGRYAVTGSDDKTVRVWSVKDGRLLSTIRLPAGRGDIGKVYAVALSPDGAVIAAGGRTTGVAGQEKIYLFDRATGTMVGGIDGLPDAVLYLTFSPDGRHLAATLTGVNGLRVYDRHAGWAEVARDANYADQSYGADFSADGRLATTSVDGQVRLYDRSFRLVAQVETSSGQHPFGIAFSPDGAKLAVGYADSTAVDCLDGGTLAALPSPDTDGIDNGNLGGVAWAADGRVLFAGGGYQSGDGGNPVVAWADAGAGGRRELPTGNDVIRTLAPLPNGDLLVASGDPYLAVLDSDGGARWAETSRQADFRDQHTTLAVSFDGQTVDFGYEVSGNAPARFDVTTRSLQLDLPADNDTAPPEHGSLPIQDWENSLSPTLAGASLSLYPYETSRSIAIHPKGDRFLLGTNWSLRCYDGQGELLWRQAVPGDVWAANISGDGRLVVAAYADGTIRWHRMDDGRELLAFLPLADRTNWVAWTPEGFYAATPGAHGVVRWHLNHGWDAPGEALPVSDIAELRRPEVLPLVLQELEIVRALALADLNEARLATQRRLNSAIKPGTQLHVLAVGVGEYNEKGKRLRLQFADNDALDVASALLNTQGSLYAKINPSVLLNDEATRVGIFLALNSIQKAMQQDDVAVFHFSGHAALVGDAVFLLPHDVDPRLGAAIEATAIEIGDLRTELLRLAERGRVLVLLDACRSEAITEDGANTTVDATQLRTRLAAANVTVLTSCSGNENSIEDEKWQNGAFTEVLLKALGGEADSDRNGVVSMTELVRYVTVGVPRLVHELDPERQQTPGVEMRFEETIFAVGSLVNARDVDSQWEELTFSMQGAYERGKLNEAETFATRALALAQQSFPASDRRVISSTFNLAALYSALGRYNEAQELYGQTIAQSESTLGPNHPDLISIYSNLAFVYVNTGRFRDAEAHYKKALDMSRKVLGEHSPTTLATLNNIANLYEQEARFAEAETLYEDILRRRELVLGPHHPDTLISANNLGTIYVRKGRYDKAQRLYEETLKRREEVLGPNHLDTLVSMVNLADLFLFVGEDVKAKTLYERVVQTSRTTLGENHPQTVSVMVSLAELYVRKGLYLQAEQLYNEALPGLTETFGDGSERVKEVRRALDDMKRAPAPALDRQQP